MPKLTLKKGAKFSTIDEDGNRVRHIGGGEDGRQKVEVEVTDAQAKLFSSHFETPTTPPAPAEEAPSSPSSPSSATASNPPAAKPPVTGGSKPATPSANKPATPGAATT